MLVVLVASNHPLGPVPPTPRPDQPRSGYRAGQGGSEPALVPNSGAAPGPPLAVGRPQVSQGQRDRIGILVTTGCIRVFARIGTREERFGGIGRTVDISPVEASVGGGRTSCRWAFVCGVRAAALGCSCPMVLRSGQEPLASPCSRRRRDSPGRLAPGGGKGSRQVPPPATVTLTTAS